MVRGVPSEPHTAQLVAHRQMGQARASSSTARALRRTLLLASGPLLLIGLLSWPMLFTDAGFTGEWVNHLWLMWDQSLSLQANLHPSYFLVTYHHSVFYPEFAFYGGTLNTVFALGSLVLGAPLVVYVASYLLGFAASYGGWYWMARQAGVGRWWAHAPGIVFVTSAYYLTLIYERGDWPEFMAISSIPLMAASALSLLRSERARLAPALALAASGVIYGGSHPLTLLWGSSVLALTALLAFAFIPQTRRLVLRRGTLLVAALLGPALLLSAWWVLPAVAYEGNTLIAARNYGWQASLRGAEFMVAANHIFSFSRDLGKTSEVELPLALPVLAIAWSLLSVPVFLRRGLRGPWGRLLLLCTAVGTLVTIAMTHAGIVLAMPHPYTMLQFPYRLETYVLLATSGAVLAGLALAQRAHGRARRWAWALVPALVVGIVGAIQQTGAYTVYGGRAQATTQHLRPRSSEEGLLDYENGKLPYLQYKHHRRGAELIFPVTAAHDGRVSVRAHLPPKAAVYTNLGGGPEFVHVSGAKIIALGPNDNDILQIDPRAAVRTKPSAGHPAQWTEVVSVSERDGPPALIGRALSLAALLLLAGALLTIATRRVRAAR
jgi:hypothetical protein